ncbi:TonB-dependent receptor [Porticoccus sp. GXU_MW_L64]
MSATIHPGSSGFISTAIAALMRNSMRKVSAGLLYLLLVVCVPSGLQAAEQQYQFDIPATDLAMALRLMAQQSNTPLLFSHSDIGDTRSQPLKGQYSVREALAILLKGSRLAGEFNQNGVLTIAMVKAREGGKDMPFKKKTGLAAFIAAITGAGASAGVLAQEGAGDIQEEIVIKGIRGSLERSLSIKENSTGFVDAISAEDVGKLPDQNVAEALQRVPGVAIQRNRGEGDFVSIRGLGPEFVRGTVNGRTLLSATEFVDPNINGGINTSTGRASNFDILPSEIINTLEVIKTSSAKHVEGGIGGVVNLKTARPLTLGHKLAGTIQGVYRDFNEDTDPSVSGLYSWANDSETFGILTSVSYSERSIREDLSRTFGYFPSAAVGTVGPFDIDNDGTSDAVTSIPFPLSNNLESISESRDRYTVTSTLEWSLDDGNTDIVADIFYTNREISSSGSNLIFLPIPFPGDLSGQTVNPDGSIQVGDLVSGGAFTVIPSSLRPELTTDLQDAEDENIAFGLNVTREVGSWTLVGDLSYSKAEGINRFDRVRHDGNNGTFLFETTVTDGGFNIVQTNAGGGANTDLGNADNFVVSVFEDRIANNDDEELAFQFDAKKDVESNFISSFEIGARYRTREKENTRSSIVDGSVVNQGVTAGAAGFIRGASDFLDGGFNSTFAYDSLAFPDNAAQRAALGIVNVIPNDPFGTFDVEESTFAAYFQVNLDGTIGGIPYAGDVGFRVVSTQQDVNGFDAELRVQDNGGQDTTVFDGFTSGDATPFSSSETYSNVLPSLNLRFELSENLFLRVAASKTLTRPTFNDLSPGLSLNPNCSCDNNGDNFAVAATAGNPGLSPYESTNFDVGVEWYFAESSALYVGVFDKVLEDYIAVVTNNNVSNLGSANIRAIGIEQDGSSAPIALDQLSQPDNQGEAQVTGLEFGYLHAFESGFGYNFNVTLAENSAEFLETGADIAFPGVSDLSYNLTAFYEKDNFEARLSYSYRSDYLLVPDGVGGLGSQIFAESFGQLDGSISYSLNDSVTLFANVVNLTDEEQELFERIPGAGDRFESLSHVGTRFAFGVRGTF